MPFPQSLPIDPILPALKEAVRAHPAVILKAPPGSGKTTRVPLALLEIFPPKGRIVLLEPRRLAAVGAARWMARGLGEKIGQTLGYSIRFDRRVTDQTRIEVVTEGILTRRLTADPALAGVALVIFDEFHERSLQADLNLAFCLDVQRNLREELKILVMSATLDCGPLAALLGEAPVIQTEGRLFPVEERYVVRGSDRPLAERVAGAVTAALRETAGDLLVFLPGAGEIWRAAEALQALDWGSEAEPAIHPLFGDLPFEEQEKAILPSKKRKVVLATNIAETSLTIEGVQVVIDSGLARRLRYDPRTGMNRLFTVPISRASAEQRRGRAGRLGPGVCYRLYDPQVFQSLAPYTPPEILTLDQASLVLELAAWGVKDPGALSWLDPPPRAGWEEAGRLLVDLGALDAQGTITRIGREMVRLPLHPRLSHLLIKSFEFGCPRLGADLAALLSERDILRPQALSGKQPGKVSGLSERLDLLQDWRKGKQVTPAADSFALQAVDRVARELLKAGKHRSGNAAEEESSLIPRLLVQAYPDRLAQKRVEGSGRFLLARGPGVRLAPGDPLAGSPFIVALQVEGAQGAEGRVHLAEPVTETLIRKEVGERISSLRRVEWDKKEGRIVSVLEERLGALVLSVKPLSPAQEETARILCAEIRSAALPIPFRPEVRQLQGRIRLLGRTFPEENWPDLSDEQLQANPEEWLAPFLAGIRSREQLAGLDILPSLLSLLTREQRRLLEQRAPTALTVPSGRRIPLDYSAGEVPVLAVKLQEMFGQADTPTVGEGRVQVLIHLLSPARRPVQVTQDLRGFWNSGYIQVKKELQGRYPKHPWPDDPWKAVPTREIKGRKR
ncbi:MAG: ATP-dependent helicase HrpB [Deltaproteobacteria bacterium]|nr:ATP-dependent helicase HrpB [Deltaproteobacteria bacterium]